MPLRVIQSFLIFFVAGGWLLPQFCYSGVFSDQAIIDKLKKEGDSLKISNPQQALVVFLELEKLANSNNDPELLAETYINLGICNYYLHDLPASQQLYFKALEVAEDLDGRPDLHARIYNNVAWNLQVQEEWDEALEYYRICLPIGRSNGDSTVLERVLNNCGVVYNNLGRYDEAMEMFEESLRINRKLGRREAEAFNLNNYGNSLFYQKRYREAITYFERALNINYERGQFREITSNLANIGSSLIELGELTAANDSLLYGLKLADSLSLPTNKAELLRYMAEVRKKQGNYREALEYRDEYISLRDSLFGQEQRRFISELQARYETARREKELEMMNGRLNRQKFLVGMSVSFLLAAVLFAALVYRNYLRNRNWNRKLLALNAEIAEKSERLERMNEQIRSVNENLESLVLDKTRQVLDQNEKLRHFGFVNAHKVRAPLARIKGLLHIMNFARSAEEHKEIYSHLSQSASELDEILTGLGHWLYASEMQEDREDNG